MKIHWLSTYHYADGEVGEVFEYTIHFKSLRGKLCCSQVQYIEVNCDLCSNKTPEKTLNASILLVWCYPSVRQPLP